MLHFDDASRAAGRVTISRPDERIYDDVCLVLAASTEIDASGVNVRVERGEVTLTGTVCDRWSKRIAEDLADHVRGVREVHNELELRPCSLPPPPSGGRAR